MKIKKIHLFLISALTLISFFGCNKEEPQDSPYSIGAEKYYMSSNKKIFLYEILGRFVIQLDTAQVFETALQQLKENPEIDYIFTLIEEDYLVIVDSKLTLGKIKQQPAVINAMPAYNVGKSITPINLVYLTGELLLELKEGCSIDDGRYLFEYKAVVKNKGKYNNYVLQVKNWEDIFDLGNTIYFHEKVSYCHPNMNAYITRF